MENRKTLHQILVDLLGSPNVYFQPPESLKMSYPCIRYSLETIPTTYADDGPYKTDERYLIIFMTRDPDSTIPKAMANTKRVSYDRYYVADNIHHHVFTYTFH